MPPIKPVKPTAAKPPTKPAVAKTTGPSFYNDKGKPDPNGLYDKDGYMVKVPGKQNNFPNAAQKGTDSSKVKGADGLTPAQRAGFKN